MPRIPILPDVRFRDALPEHHKVVTRLRRHLLALREPPVDGGSDGDGGVIRDDDNGEGTDSVSFGGEPPEEGRRKPDAGPGYRWSSWAPLLTDGDEARIARRARQHVERVTAATGLAHLDREQRERLAVLRDGATVMALPTEHRADEIAAGLHADMPWMAPATEAAWHAMRASVRNGDVGLRLPPMLLVGPPGIGKSHWARALGKAIGAPVTVIDATSEPASWSVVRLQRGWGSQGPGRLVETILATRAANPLVVIDEIDKAGDATTDSGLSHGMANALLPLLERSTAARWSCPYFRVRFDMSWVGWVLTANAIDGLPTPLLSRVPPLMLPDLSREQLIAFARREAARRALPTEVADDIAAILERLSDRDRPSLRTVVRMVERAEAVHAMPVLH